MAEPENPLELDENPTPEEESEGFSTSDERSDTRAKNHELGLLKAKMGPIGGLIGSTDSSKTIAFVSIFLIVIFMIVIFLWPVDKGTGVLPDSSVNLFTLLVPVITGCIGFIFGSKKD